MAGITRSEEIPQKTLQSFMSWRATLDPGLVRAPLIHHTLSRLSRRPSMPGLNVFLNPARYTLSDISALCRSCWSTACLAICQSGAACINFLLRILRTFCKPQPKDRWTTRWNLLSCVTSQYSANNVLSRSAPSPSASVHVLWWGTWSP